MLQLGEPAISPLSGWNYLSNYEKTLRFISVGRPPVGLLHGWLALIGRWYAVALFQVVHGLVAST